MRTPRELEEELSSSPGIGFDLLKKATAKEVIIEDIILTVVDYSPMPPTKFAIANGLLVSEETRILFQLSKPTELPCVFRPIRVLFCLSRNWKIAPFGLA
jgi:hypothetical protein